ncbi:MAG TPA: ABC transporter substrate-binding protein, partial [Burkholderiaceae bacterium]|nr:ABC transporter substrate-binding protein [Burkholderiaceae bacterium]
MLSRATAPRRSFIRRGCAAALAALLAPWARAEVPAAAATPKKVLRYAFEVAETGLDPAKISDLYSRTLTPHIFEALYRYDHLARPVKLKSLTADGMPEASADFRVWTIKVKPGIYFADDPAFKGRKRELVAQDYVYAIKRFADPANKSPAWSSLEADGVVGLAAVRQAALDTRRPFDYDREIEGLRALDRYTLQFKLNEARPRFVNNLAASDLYGAVAREVVEFYGEKIDAHPVGTGPFRLAQWRRSSFIVFERNPGFRAMVYDAEPAADDAEGQALLARFKGRRLPMVDRVEISIIEEEQPRWLAFVNDEADFAYRVGYQFAPQAMPNGKVAPNLAKRGIRGYPVVEAAANFFFFNMEDPTVGGYSAEKVALRRAIGLGLDVKGIIDYAYSGLGAPAQGATLPKTSAYDPKFKSEFSDYDPARAKALLDLYGYTDRSGDGWRDLPDGTPLVLKVSTTPNQRDRKIAEVLTKNMKALGIRVQSLTAQWPENLKAARAGKLQMWALGLSAASPDAAGSYARFDSHQIGGQNLARVRLPAFDTLYNQLQTLPDGPERLAAFREMDRLSVAYMPYKFSLNRVSLDMAQPQLIGYRRTPFW